MPDKTWADLWLLNPWTGFWMSSAGLLTTAYGVFVARGARAAAQKTERQLKELDRSIGITRMVDSMASLKQNLSTGNLAYASLTADSLRTECVKLKQDKDFIKNTGFDVKIDGLIIYFGTIEKHINDGTFLMNVDSFNFQRDLLTELEEGAKGVMRNAARR